MAAISFLDKELIQMAALNFYPLVFELKEKYVGVIHGAHG